MIKLHVKVAHSPYLTAFIGGECIQHGPEDHLQVLNSVHRSPIARELETLLISALLNQWRSQVTMELELLFSSACDK
jgi:hypothetical protein